MNLFRNHFSVFYLQKKVFASSKTVMEMNIMRCNTKEATTFTVAFSMDRGPLDMLVQIVQAGKTDAVLL